MKHVLSQKFVTTNEPELLVDWIMVSHFTTPCSPFICPFIESLSCYGRSADCTILYSFSRRRRIHIMVVENLRVPKLKLGDVLQHAAKRKVFIHHDFPCIN